MVDHDECENTCRRCLLLYMADVERVVAALPEDIEVIGLFFDVVFLDCSSLGKVQLQVFHFRSQFLRTHIHGVTDLGEVVRSEI